MNYIYQKNIATQTESKFLNVMAFIIGVMSYVNFKLIGDFYPVEVILAFMVPLLWSRKSGLLRDQHVKILLMFGSLWLMSQLSTDLFRQTTVTDSLRGCLSVLFFLFDFVGLYILISGRLKRLMIFLMGYSIGGVLQQSIFPSVLGSAHPWKFGYGFSIALLLLIFIVFINGNNTKKLKWWALPLAVFGILSIYLDYRSLGAISILTAFMISVRCAWLNQMLIYKFRPMFLFMAGVIVLSVGLSIIKIYGYSSEQGWLGDHAKMKYEMQASGSGGILLGGRMEWIAGVPAIIDSPFIGHGSWAKNSNYRELYRNLIDLNYGLSAAEIDKWIKKSDLIPAHSHILQSWIWAGFLGALFWFVVLYLVLKVMIHAYRFPSPLLVIVLFFSILSIWDIFFSPFGSTMRMQWAFRLVIFVTSYQLSQYVKRGLLIK